MEWDYAKMDFTLFYKKGQAATEVGPSFFNSCPRPKPTSHPGFNADALKVQIGSPNSFQLENTHMCKNKLFNIIGTFNP